MLVFISPVVGSTSLAMAILSPLRIWLLSLPTTASGSASKSNEASAMPETICPTPVSVLASVLNPGILLARFAVSRPNETK